MIDFARRCLLLALVFLASCGHHHRSPTRTVGSPPHVIDSAKPTAPAEDMVSVPAGPALVPQEPFRCAAMPTSVPAFQIDRNLVGCPQMQACIDAGACPEAASCRYDANEIITDDLTDKNSVRVVAAVHDVAAQYCAWRHARLPSLAEWQRAARGPSGMSYPTGSTWDEKVGCTLPTGQHQHGADPRCKETSPAGMTYFVDDGRGEWTQDTDCVSQLNASGEPYLNRELRVPVEVFLWRIKLDGWRALADRTFTAQFRCARSLPNTANAQAGGPDTGAKR